MGLERRPDQGENLATYKPEVVILNTSEVDNYGWSIFENQIKSKPNSVLTLATGSSPLGIYKLWIEAVNAGLDCSQLTTKNLDEYVGLTKGHPQSYDQFMKDNLFDHINIPASQRFIPDTLAKEPHKEAQRYQALINKIGPSDLTILGLGPALTCHIAFNERGSKVHSGTRVIAIDEDTVQANARFFDREQDVPRLAITQGVADILNSKKIILIAKGLGKAAGIQRTLEGPINSDAPASFLRLHPNVTFIIDKDAGSLLKTIDVA